MRLEQLKQVLKYAHTEWALALIDQMPQWDIDAPNEEASFMAMVAQESKALSTFEENLSYSAGRLVAVWPNRFYLGQPVDGKRNAGEYASNGRRLAEFVYGGRMGNGPEGSGDGWKYRGRGPVQITGRKNYTAAEDALGLSLVVNPDLVLTPSIGARVACWFWKANGFDSIDDDNDVRAETRKLQGGTEGLEARQKYFDAFMRVLA
jgi:putative chitinase